MSVNIRNVPDYEQLLNYIPQSEYTRNAVTQNRVITKLSSEQALVNDYQPNIEAVFRIAPSTSTLLNLAECYFSITGQMSLKTPTDVGKYPSLKCAALWILRMYNKLTLEIGGCAVHSVTTPALLAKLYESLAINYNDKEAGVLINDGFYPGTSKSNYFGDNVTTEDYATDTNQPFYCNFEIDPTYKPITGKGSIVQKPGLPKSSIALLGVSETANGNASDEEPSTDKPYLIYKFKINLRLRDIFPIETMRPIYGQSVVIKAQHESKGFTGIISSYGNSPIITKFEQYYLNVYQYNINVEMQNKLNQVYSKPVVEIVDAVDKQLQSIPSINAESEVQVFIPLATQFETQYVAIFMPHCVSNNAYDGLMIGPDLMNYPTAKNFTQHTPNDYRFFNPRRISVIADGSILYERTFDENPFEKTSKYGLFNSPLQPLVINCDPAGATANTLGAGVAYTALETVPLNDYTNAYELYKECRCYWDVTEESAIPFDEWLYSGFAIIIPTTPFSRLTTGSQVVLTISFSTGLTSESTYPTFGTNKLKNIKLNERITAISTADAEIVRTEALKQLCVVQKYRKALVYQGFNNCVVKTISQSFTQDINVEEPNEEKISAN